MLLDSQADLSPLEVLAQVGVDRQSLDLRLGQHRPDVDHLGQRQVEGLQGVGPVLLSMKRGNESERLQHFVVFFCAGAGISYYVYVTIKDSAWWVGDKLVPVGSNICGLCRRVL